MNKIKERRIQKEIEDVDREGNVQGDGFGIKLVVIDNNITHLKAFINGPSDTPYEGGIYQIDIQLPAQYPFKPPKMKFDTKIWHPNISLQTGEIDLEFLNGEWSPLLSIRTALLSVQALLCDPQPVCPLDEVVQQQKDLFIETAKEWTQKYASKSDVHSEQQKKVNNLVVKGFEEAKVKEALLRFGWDEEQAANFLLGQ